MQVKIMLRFRAEGSGTHEGVAEKTFDLPALPFDYVVTVHLGRTELTSRFKAVTWDDTDGLTLRMDDRKLQKLNVVEIPPTPDQILWEDIREEEKRQDEKGWKVTHRP